MSKQVITFHYVLTDKSGATLDSSRGAEPLAFLEGTGQIIPGLEKTLVAMKKGDKKEVHVPYVEAYGSYDQTLIYKVGKEKFPTGQQVKIGDVFEIGKDDNYRVVTVVDIAEKEITLDANHPLAGKDLTFNVEIMDIRSATSEELSHGHVHGEGGHHHH